jgi:hypothetical protein
MIAVGTKDQVMICTRKLLHQCFFILTPRSAFCGEHRNHCLRGSKQELAMVILQPLVEALG